MIVLFLIEQLAAGGAIDFGAQLSDTIFVGVLHVSLAGDQACEDIIPKRKIGCSGGRPHAEHDDSADHDPEYHRSEPDLFAGMHQRIAGLRTWYGRGMVRGRAANGCPTVVMRMVLGVLGIMTGTVRHRHSRAVPTGDPAGQARARDLTVSWLIFSEWNQ